jgi:MATE family multidrug resistance protein
MINVVKLLSRNPVLQIALPAIISNITVPLLGLVDVAIVGHMGSAVYIGAIAVGGLLFNIIYWIFGFLRMGTSGMTSQAFGSRNLDETVQLLVRSVATGLLIGAALIVLQYPLLKLAFAVLHPEPEVVQMASLYFRILIWGAPAVLGLYAFAGWYIGMQNTRIPMLIAIVQNVVNIAVSLCLVYGLGMQVEGVAIGTLVAQYAGLLLSVLFWNRYFKPLRQRIKLTGLWDRKVMLRFFAVNRDIFLRTLCLVAVTLFFTSASASQGAVILAVNTLLMQLFTLFSYFMDGFAYAGEALVGKYVGSRNSFGIRHTVNQLFRWGVGISLVFALLYAAGEDVFFNTLTNDAAVIHEAGLYSFWAMAIPLAGFAAFLWDGIYIGATATRYMLSSMMLAMLSFFAVYFILRNSLGNHALWFAFIVYLSIRGFIQSVLAGKAIISIK